MNMIEFQKRFSDEAACREFLEQVRWPHGVECPRCGAVGRASRLRTRLGNWTCLECKKSQFTVTCGTPLHRTHLPLTKWFLAIWLIATSSKGVSGKKLSEWLKVDYKTAWFMGHCIRRMLAEPQWSKISGIVEADEMYVGGRKKPEDDNPGSGSGGSKRGRGAGRAAVLVAVARDGGARAKRIATHSSEAIGLALREIVEPDAVLFTDGLPAYRKVGRAMAGHETVDHGRGRFARGNVHVNTAEGFIGLFRRAVQGTWHRISHKHVDAYLVECSWRYDRRRAPSVEKFSQALAGLCAGPLSFRELVA